MVCRIVCGIARWPHRRRVGLVADVDDPAAIAAGSPRLPVAAALVGGVVQGAARIVAVGARLAVPAGDACRVPLTILSAGCGRLGDAIPRGLRGMGAGRD